MLSRKVCRVSIFVVNIMCLQERKRDGSGNYLKKQRSIELSIEEIIERYVKNQKQDSSIRAGYLPEYVLRQ